MFQPSSIIANGPNLHYGCKHDIALQIFFHVYNMNIECGQELGGGGQQGNIKFSVMTL